MPKLKASCVVCSKPATGYNYGALVCSACKMFFKRALFRTTIKECGNFANCKSRCSFCRFQKCLQVGMVYNPYSKTYDFQNYEIIFSAILKSLAYLDDHRQNLFINCTFNGDPSIADSITFIPKPKEFQNSYEHWAFMCGLTSLDFFRKLGFMKNLELSDQASILQSSFKQFGLFGVAHDSFESKKALLEFPDGIELPEKLDEVSQGFRNRMQCRMVGRIIELKLTKEEFLLLSVILLCNPDE